MFVCHEDLGCLCKRWWQETHSQKSWYFQSFTNYFVNNNTTITKWLNFILISFFFSRRIKLFSTRKHCLLIFKCFTIFNFILIFDKELYKLKISYIQVHVYYKTVKVFFANLWSILDLFCAYFCSFCNKLTLVVYIVVLSWKTFLNGLYNSFRNP